MENEFERPPYDPDLDEPRYTKRQFLDELKSAVKEFVEVGKELMLAEITSCPLSFEGRWTPDTVYKPGSYVHHNARGWVTSVETASEPSEQNAFWRVVRVPDQTPSLREGR